MKRTSSLVAALTGATLLIAGCSSTSGTATPGSSISSSAAAVPSAASSALSSAPAGAASSDLSSSAPMSSAVSSAAAGSAAAGSTPAGSESAGSSASGSGDLDARSTAWVTVACTGLAPLVGASTAMGSLASSASTDLAGAVKKLATVLDGVGTSLTKTAATLKGMPAPTFADGDAIAAKTIDAFASAGPEITGEAKKLASDPTSITSTQGGLTTSLTKAIAPLDQLDSLPTGTRNAITTLPACAKLGALAGG